jgi:hypothetical protein
VKKKVSFIFWFDVLYHIVNKYEVVAFILSLWLLRKEKILTDESSLLVIFREEHSCFIDTFLTDVNTRYFTALLCEGKQIAALATTYFQHTGVWR